MRQFAGQRALNQPVAVAPSSQPHKANINMSKKKRTAVASASNTSSTPDSDAKRRRVSFNKIVEKSDGIFDDSTAAETATKTPTKSILKVPPKLAASSKPKKATTTTPPTVPSSDKSPENKKSKTLKSSTKAVKKIEGLSSTAKAANKSVTDLKKASSKASANAEVDDAADAGVPKKKVKLQITKAMKQKLREMPRNERKRYLRELREKQKPLYELSKQAKRLWEKVRSSKTSKKDREEKVEELCSLVRGKVDSDAGHATVRVIQYLMSLNNRQIRDWLFGELVGDVVRMAKSKYAKFFLIKMLKYGTPEQREQVLRACEGRLPELLRNAFSGDVVEYAYNQHANAAQRWRIVAQFYGKQAALAEVPSDVKQLTLQHLLSQQPLLKPVVLNSIKEHLLSVIDKPAFRHSLVHRLLMEYIDLAEPAQVQEMCHLFLDRIPEILHTRDGAHASMHAIWNSSAKERKTLVKNLKGLVSKTAVEAQGSLVLMALCDCVDDTVMLNKTVIQEMVAGLPTILQSKHGQRVVDHVLRPRDGRYLQKEQRALLAKGDSNVNSKKSAEVRSSELRVGLLPAVLDYIGEHMQQMLTADDKHQAVFVLNALEQTQLQAGSEQEKAVDAQRQKCFDAIADMCAVEFIPANFEGALHCVEHPRSHFVLGRLLKCDAWLCAADRPTLTQTLINRLAVDDMTVWTACNKGCFVLTFMLQSGHPSTSVLRNGLQSYLDKLAGLSHAGAAALLNALRNK